MPLRSAPRRLAGIAFTAALVGATVTTVPAANAAPVFSDSVVYGTNYSEADGCPETSGSTSPNPEVPVVENGPAVTYSQSASSTHEGAGGDTATGATQVTATVSIKSAGGLPVMDFSATGSTQATFAQDPSECRIIAGSNVDVEARFTLTQSGVLQLTTEGRGRGFQGSMQVYTDADVPVLAVTGSGSRFTGGGEVFLQPGTYRLFATSGSSISTTTAETVSGSISARAEFHAAGSQTTAPDGKGKKYVKFPGSRNCAAHTLTPSITEKGKRAKKIQSVRFFVNGANVKKVRDPKKGQAVALTIADDQDADVRALVKLEKVKRGVPAKKLEVTTSYLACS